MDVDAAGVEDEEDVEDDDDEEEGDDLDSTRTLIFLSLGCSAAASDLRLRDDDSSFFCTEKREDFMSGAIPHLSAIFLHRVTIVKLR